MQALKAHTSNLLLKTFTQLLDVKTCRFAPNTPDPLCVKDTIHLIRFARNGSNQRSLTLDISCLSSLGSSFLIEIQTYARTGVPYLFLTMCPFSISTDEYVSLNFRMTKRLRKITKIHRNFNRTSGFLEL